MTTDVPTSDWARLGRALRERREAKGMFRRDVESAGGPSVATVQRIEEGKIRRDVKYATKRSHEHALGLPEGWIDDFLAGRVEPPEGDPDPVVIEGNGERLLVAITDGASRLTIEERRAVLALVQGLQRGQDA